MASLSSKEEPDISLSIVNSKARFIYSRVTPVLLARSAVALSIHVAMVLYVRILDV